MLGGDPLKVAHVHVLWLFKGQHTGQKSVNSAHTASVIHYASMLLELPTPKDNKSPVRHSS